MKRDFPFPAYPNGWFAVRYSDELVRGQVSNIRYFGRDWVLFRDEEDRAHIVQAHCPHLGAHLGHGGKVEGCAIRCPFHAWLFDANSGDCVEIPYAKRIPSKAKIEVVAVEEQNGLIYMWHHAEGEEPDGELRVIEEYGSEGWGDYTRYRWSVESRMYDMGENAFDNIHFKTLHGAKGSPGYSTRKNTDGTTSNYSEMKMVTPKGNIEGSIDSRSYGPGFGLVHVKGVVETIIVLNSTPIDEENVDVRFSYLQRSDLGEKMSRVGEKMVQELKRQMEQDIVIFEHKKYLTQPLLIPEDGPIADYRRRAREHYSGAFWDDAD
jgi:3-ketosteroid 9alpha-monooxygenase subunit A